MFTITEEILVGVTTSRLAVAKWINTPPFVAPVSSALYDLIKINETSEFDSPHHEDSSKFIEKQMMLVKTAVSVLQYYTDPFTTTGEILMNMIANE